MKRRVYGPAPPQKKKKQNKKMSLSKTSYKRPVVLSSFNRQTPAVNGPNSRSSPSKPRIKTDTIFNVNERSLETRRTINRWSLAIK